MKKTFKLIGLIVMAAIIGFSTAGCDNGTEPSSGPVSVTSVRLNRTAFAIAENGTVTLTATVIPKNATNKQITWSSDDENVATVEDGVVSAVAVGTATITVTTDDGKKKENCVITVTDVDFIVCNTNEWNAAKTAIRDGGNDQSYTVYVNGNVAIAGSTDNTFGAVSGTTVTLKGSGTLSLSSTGNLLRAGANQTLIIDGENLTLKGRSGNDNSVVYIGSATAALELRNGMISGNTNTSSDISRGGGVYMSGGTFIMSGGEIHGNKSIRGGGVYMGGGTFTMSGGEISGNTASNNGGGVYVLSGTFRISNGTIYGDDEDDLSNTAATGSVLYRASGAAEYGSFSGTTWNKVGSLSTTNDTIMVINGELSAKISAITAQFWRTGSGITSYSNTVTIQVISATAREVTIDMYDSGNDGWNANGALRITVNGTEIATGVRVETTAAVNTPRGQRSTNTYTFFVETGDIVNVYWTVGTGFGYQYENSFIVHYADTPPSPVFTTSNNNNWNGTNALIYRLRTTSGTTGSSYLTNVANGTLLGSFTVP